MVTHAVPQRAEGPIPRFRRAIWVGLAAVVAVYVIPVVIPLIRNRQVQPVKMQNETIYLVRVAAAIRGESLANPYLAGHDGLPNYLPELSERVLAATARASGATLAEVTTTVRVLQPALIFVLVAMIGLELGLQPFFASVAGLITTLTPSLSQAPWQPSGYPGFLRYLRFLSPGVHVVIFLAALLLICRCWRKPQMLNAIVAGFAIGINFYVPIFYWSVLWAGTVALVIVNVGDRRRALLVAALIGAVLAIPFAATSIRNSANPIVLDTLHRWPTLMLLPGRSPENVKVPLALAFVGLLGLAFRRTSRALLFLAPFFVMLIPLALQNVITNRQIQAEHFVDPALPLAAIAVAEVAAGTNVSARVLSAFLTLLVAGAALRMFADEHQLARLTDQKPQAWDLLRCMPHTLAELKQHTPPGSVVISSPEIMDILPIFSRNKVYYANYARQHAASDAEINIREGEAEAWPQGLRFTYRANYLLGYGEVCQRLGANEAFKDPVEHTCIYALTNRGPF